MTDHKCNECVRMTVSQDEYISILEEQNERLKCCGNCKHWNNEGIQKYCVATKPDFLIKRRKDICDKWEIEK